MDKQTPTKAIKRRLEDEYLVVSVQAGDGQAFTQLVQRWHGRLLAHALRLTQRRDVAEDAVQAGWTDIIRGLSKLRDERAFPAWAYRIVTRRVMKSYGAALRETPLEEITLSDDAATLDETALLNRTDLRKALSKLAPIHRAAVALHYFEELSIAEVAVALDVPAGTIKTRLMHARAHLRAKLEGGNDV